MQRTLNIAAAVGVLAVRSFGATLTYDTSASTGFQSDNGPWNLNTAATWSSDGTTLVPWSSAADTASFNLSAAYTGKAATVSNASGQVGAAGLVFSGDLGSSGTWQVGGGSLQVGSSGIRNSVANGAVTISAPLQLTSSQTWYSNRNAADVLKVGGGISSASGTTNLTFDGLSAGTSTTFNLSGTNSFTGSTTVKGGATLKLDYSTNNTRKLDPTSSLTLNYGKILVVGTSASSFGESVASTSIGAGANVYSKSTGNGTGVFSFGNVTRSVGSTLELRSVDARLSNANEANGILSGWAVAVDGLGWVVSNGSGSNITTTGGTFSNAVTNWNATTNVSYFASTATLTADTSASLLCFRQTGGVAVNLNGKTLTIVNGGVDDYIGGSSITNGKLTTGMSTGELFVYSASTGGTSISSQIVDNASTPTILVKGSSQTLTLSGANTYTGKTFVNQGALTLTGSAIGTVKGGLAVAAGSTFTPGAVYAVQSGKTVSGGGTIANSVDASGAAIEPGDAEGTLTIQGGLTLDSASQLNFDLNDVPGGIANDQILLSQAATRSLVLDGTLHVSNLGALSVGTYTLISGATSITDNGLDVSIPGVAANVSHDLNNVYLNITAVPEPGSIAFVSCSLGLALLRRRRGDR